MANGWNAGKKKPLNLYKFFKGTGLITVFPSNGGLTFVYDGRFYGPFPTQEYACVEDEEENTEMSEANSNAAQQQEAPQYVTKARFDRLVAYVQELVTEHNRLDARVVEFERHEQNSQRIEAEVAARG
jgi:hypothetical protein